MGYKENIASNLGSQIIRIAVGALTGIVVARVLGPAGMGKVAYILLVFTLLGDYGHLGLNNANMYFLKRGAQSRKHLFGVNVTSLAMLSLLAATAVLSLRATGLILQSYHWGYIVAGLAFSISDLFFTNLQSWYVGDERIRESNRYIIGVFLLKNALILGLWISGMLSPFRYFSLMVLGMLLNATLLWLKVRQKYTPAFDFGLLRSEFGYGGILWLGSIFSFLFLRADQFMIKNMLGLAELGTYSISVSLAELLFLVPISVSSAFLGKLYNTEDPNAARLLLSRTLKLTLYACAALAAVGIPLSFLIPFVYGKAYTGAIYSTMVLLVGAVLSSPARVGMQYFFTLGRPKVHLWASLATLLTNISLNFVLIPRLGILGAAIASGIAYALYGLIYIFLFLGPEKFSFNELFLLNAKDLQELFKRP
ncbi:MAG: polysaccharide biosynthesis C-terminal domain-containing protein [Candidatus Cloacimonadaceae bacterium]|jgi:O-antigen/teichoic acid export membrane protein|nr:polysaccharide biosynthesis C-terminal domain-containing protein [Candidatus Cloacimonadota bacterium]MDX9950010.1 polysaccharide biosynthesis C-terminal domain-containing protein [Candidatus Syntrophosphaera sp.]